MRVPPSKNLAFALFAAALVAASCSGRGKTAVTQPSCKPNETLTGGKCTPSVGAQQPLSPQSTFSPPPPPLPPSPPLGPLSPSPDNGTLISPTPGLNPLSPSSPTVTPAGPRPPSPPSPPSPQIQPSPGPRPPSPAPQIQPSPGPRPPSAPAPAPAPPPTPPPTNVTPPSLGGWNGAPANAGDGAPWVKVVYVTNGGRLVAFAALSHKEQVSDFKFVFGKEAVPAPGAASTSGGFVGNAALKLPVKLELLFNNVRQCYSAEAGFAEVTVEPKPC